MALFETDGYVFDVTTDGVWMHKPSVKSMTLPEFKQAYRAALNEHNRMVKQAKRRLCKAQVYIGLDTSNNRFTGGSYKIGSSYNAETRSGTGRLQIVIECTNRKAAYDLEFELHRHFADKRAHPLTELFWLTEADLEYIRSAYSVLDIVTHTD